MIAIGLFALLLAKLTRPCFQTSSQTPCQSAQPVNFDSYFELQSSPIIWSARRPGRATREALVKPGFRYAWSLDGQLIERRGLGLELAGKGVITKGTMI
jgi:hypothetical protein